MRLRLDAKMVIGDAGAPAGWWKGQLFDRILIDAPCSATGVLRRRPDVRLHRRESDIAAMGVQQRRILSALWPLLAPGGRLVYITCSVLRAENEAIVSRAAGGAAPTPRRSPSRCRPARPRPSAGRSCPATAISMACTTRCSKSGAEPSPPAAIAAGQRCRQTSGGLCLQP